MESRYFEGTIQIRNANEQVMDFIISRFEKANVGIAKIVKVNDGYDIYSASNKFSRKLGKMLVAEFGGKIKETVRLFSRDRMTSKDIYRLTVYYKVPGIKKQDVVMLNGKIILVTSLAGRFIKGNDLLTGARVNVPNDDAKILEKKKAKVIKVKPSLEVMHPDTYQPVEVENPKPSLRIGENVVVVEYNEKLFLL
jgi:NMD protein affecting ribosome stability and mRNA decay